MDLTTVRLPAELSRAIDRVAEARQVTRSEVVRDAIEAYCRALETEAPPDRVTLLRRLVSHAGSGQPDLGTNSKLHLRRMFDARRRRHRSR